MSNLWCSREEIPGSITLIFLRVKPPCRRLRGTENNISGFIGNLFTIPDSRDECSLSAQGNYVFMKSNPDPSLQILIVEDNRTQAEYLRHLLEKKGYLVASANNGFEALEKIKEKKPDIILTDVMMPDMDGYTFCKRVKQHKNTSDVPVILVTHLYSPVDVIKGLEAGADNFIIKPYDPENIFSRISSIMQMQDLPKQDANLPPLDVVFSSEIHTITSSRMQILNILLSTYETAVKNNSELQVAHERLHYTNAQLQRLVEDLEQKNESLTLKNLERDRLETALNTSNEKIETVSKALKQILHAQVEQAGKTLSEVRGQELPQIKQLDLAGSFIENSLITLQNTRHYLKSGTLPKSWQPVRHIITRLVTQTCIVNIRYENLIPEDIELFTDDCFVHILSDLIATLQTSSQKPKELRFSFRVKENGCSIILENNDPDMPDGERDDLFPVNECCNTLPHLYLISEMLSITGLGIEETRATGQGTRYEIMCPEGSIRFVSDMSSP